MVGEAVGVGKDAATDHEAVDCRVLLMKFKCVSAIADVAIDDQFGIWTGLVAKGDDIGYEFVMGRDFTHFFFSAEMDGKGGGMFGE